MRNGFYVAYDLAHLCACAYAAGCDTVVMLCMIWKLMYEFPENVPNRRFLRILRYRVFDLKNGRIQRLAFGAPARTKYEEPLCSTDGGVGHSGTPTGSPKP